MRSISIMCLLAAATFGQAIDVRNLPERGSDAEIVDLWQSVTACGSWSDYRALRACRDAARRFHRRVGKTAKRRSPELLKLSRGCRLNMQKLLAVFAVKLDGQVEWVQPVQKNECAELVKRLRDGGDGDAISR